MKMPAINFKKEFLNNNLYSISQVLIEELDLISTLSTFLVVALRANVLFSTRMQEMS